MTPKKKTGFGRYTREQHLEKTLRGLDWREDLRLADLARAKARLKSEEENEQPQTVSFLQQTA